MPGSNRGSVGELHETNSAAAAEASRGFAVDVRIVMGCSGKGPEAAGLYGKRFLVEGASGLITEYRLQRGSEQGG